jgi:hypothetical protein
VRCHWDGSIEGLLESVLGEGQFGDGHWRLARTRRLYYAVKPLIPVDFRRQLRRWHRGMAESRFQLGWPVEPRFAEFQWATLRHLLERRGEPSASFIHFWPEGYRWAFVLTHDVETAEGQRNVRALAALEADYGLRSAFNFVAEGYRLDSGLLDDLRGQGFEVGIHGLRHDGKLFASEAGFLRQALRINEWMLAIRAEGFRAPLMHRHPGWMQALAMAYDMSFFDTDPYEPLPGGAMSIWPFQTGRFLELPTTLAQDHTLTEVLGATDIGLWLEKIAFIENYCGMALLNAHPDYLQAPSNWRLYRQFLESVLNRTEQPWYALPRDVARWWKARREAQSLNELPGAVQARFVLDQAGPGVILSPRKGDLPDRIELTAG